MPVTATDKLKELMPFPGAMNSGFAITKSDTDELASVTRAIFVGGAGAMAVVMAGGSELTITGIIAGSWLPIRVKQVKSTGTTATNIAGFY